MRGALTTISDKEDNETMPKETMRPAVQESPAAQSLSLLHPPSPSCLKVSHFHFENSNDTKLFGALGFLLAKIKLLRIVLTWHSPRQQSSGGSSPDVEGLQHWSADRVANIQISFLLSMSYFL